MNHSECYTPVYTRVYILIQYSIVSEDETLSQVVSNSLFCFNIMLTALPNDYRIFSCAAFSSNANPDDINDINGLVSGMCLSSVSLIYLINAPRIPLARWASTESAEIRSSRSSKSGMRCMLISVSVIPVASLARVERATTRFEICQSVR